MHAHPQSGFTLIELLIVVSIVTILATMAVPSYMERVIQTQVSEGVKLADFARDSVSTFYQQHRRMPNNNLEAGLPEGKLIIGNYVTSMVVESGVINITYGNRANKFIEGKKLSLRPAVVSQAPKVPISWVCGIASVPNGMNASKKNSTSLPPQHLPVECRV